MNSSKNINPKEHILNIRRMYTGESTDINQAGEVVVANLTELLTDAITNLSTNLYSKDFHFIMELVQNADDNEYHKSVKPKLVFNLKYDRLDVTNNEIGFKENNVNAICKIGKTTKVSKNGLKGYIGEKGLGFKSVFRVTDQPHIFSNGYQFKFNSNVKIKGRKLKLGYILPEWIEDNFEYINPKETTISLPFLKNISDKQKKQVFDIEPDLLLFLNKLSRLDIIDEINGGEKIIEKTIKENNIVTLAIHSTGNNKPVRKSFYIYDRQNIKVPNDKNIDQRKGVKNTRIILAFPIDSRGILITNEYQNLYSYLPVDNFGFRFIIQADFILISNRGGIDEDNKWNKWILEEIFKTFTLAIENFKKHPKYKYHFLSFVPTDEDKIDGFFSPLAKDIIEYCQNNPVLLSASDKWVRLENILLAKKETKDIFTNDYLKKTSGKEYLNDKFICTGEISETLNVSSFDSDTLIACLNNYSLLKKQNEDWFFELFKYLGSYNENEDITGSCEGIKFIPIGYHKSKALTIVSADEGTIFFPSDKTSGFSFENNIQIFSPSLYARITGIKDNKKKGQIVKFLKDLGIKPYDPLRIVQEHILVKFETDEWKTCDIIAFLKFIKAHWINLRPHHKNIIELLQDKPIIKCAVDKSNLFSRPPDIFISSIYGNNNNLEKIAEGIESIYFIHDCYLKGNIVSVKKTRNHTKKEWYSFFKTIGCKEIFEVDGNGNSAEITDIIHTNNPEKIRSLISVIDKHWNKYKGHCNHLYGRTWNKTNWFKLLSEEIKIPYNNQLYHAKDIFLRNNQFETYFGKNIRYYPDKLNINFAKAIGINVELDRSTWIQILKSYSEQSLPMTKEKITKIYRLLANDLNNNSDFSAFYENKLIFIPKQKKWSDIDEVFWSDFSSIFGKSHGYLEHDYPNDLKDFFVKSIGVKEKPDAPTLIDFLQSLSDNEVTEFKEKKTKDAIYKTYILLGRLAQHNEIDEDNLNNLKELIWTNKDSLWKNDNDIYYNDNDELFNLFKDEESIAFVQINKDDYPVCEDLLSKLEIPAISKAVSASSNDIKYAKYDEKISQKIRYYAETIKNNLYTNYIKKYEELKEKEVLEKLFYIEIFDALQLNVRYTLNGINKEISSASLIYDYNIYINHEQEDTLALIASELSKFLDCPSIFDFILILLSSSKKSISRILKIKNIAVPTDYKDPKGLLDDDNHEEEDGFSDDFEFPVNKIKHERSTSGQKDHQEDFSKKPVWKPEVDFDETSVGFEEYEGSEEEPLSEGCEGRVFNKSDFESGEGGTSRRPMSSQNDKNAIGNFGEKKVYFELKKQLNKKYKGAKKIESKTGLVYTIYIGSDTIAELKWLNDKDTNQEGYDITLTEIGIRRYYEVKATTGNETIDFQVSKPQWRFVKDKGENYSIMRVVDAGNKNIKIYEINNPYKLWKEGKLKAFPVNIEL